MISRRAFLLFGLFSLGAPSGMAARPVRQVAQVVTRPKASTSRPSSAVRNSLANGGHLDKHVGASRSYLAGRATSARAHLSFSAAAAGADLRRGAGKAEIAAGKLGVRKREVAKRIEALRGYTAKPRQVSTFHDGKTADAIYQQALRSNRDKVSHFMRTAKVGASTRIDFNAGKAIGTVYQPPGSSSGDRKGRYLAATQGSFIIQKAERNFFPKTAKLVGKKEDLE